MLPQTARQAIMGAASATIECDHCQHCQIKLLAEGSSKVTVDGNPTRNFPIARLTTYPLDHQA